MIGYTTLGVNDIQKATQFYEALFKEQGLDIAFNSERMVLWNDGKGGPMFSIVKPFDGESATVGNGTMIALNLSSPEEVDKMHQKALALGAKNEGDPGPRMGGFYCAYFRDVDGNKLNFFSFPQG